MPEASCTIYQYECEYTTRPTFRFKKAVRYNIHATRRERISVGENRADDWDSFEGGDIDRLRWVPSGFNVADGLTKRCPQMQLKLTSVCITGEVILCNEVTQELDTTTRK